MRPEFQHPEAAQHLVWFNRPDSLDNWTLPVLELVVITSSLLALLHAWRALRERNDRTPLAVWLTAICYGLVLELISYNTVDNFWHGEFTVMLYYNKLPLYIMVMYPAVLYYTWLLAAAYGMPASGSVRAHLRPALACAFSGQLIYASFDNLGPQLHWWSWDTTHSTLQPFWASVPSTSYLWMWTLCFSFPLIAYKLLMVPPGAAPRSAGSLAWRILLGGVLANLAVVTLQTPLTVISLTLGQPMISGFICACLFAAAARACVATASEPALLARQPTLGPTLWCLFMGGMYALDISTFLTADALRGNLLLGAGAAALAWQVFVRAPLQARSLRA